MAFELIGFTDAQTARKLEHAPRIAGTKVVVVEALGIAAILTKARFTTKLQHVGRRALIKRLKNAQLMLEALIKHGPLVVARGNTVLRNQQAALGLLATHRTLIDETLRSFGTKIQFQITIHTGAEDGMNISIEFKEKLLKTVDDLMLLPLEDETTLLNCAVLLAPDQEAVLDQTINEIDTCTDGKLTIKYVGPLPALSFAAIEIEQPQAKEIAKAREVLKLGVGSDHLKQKYHELVRANHPDSAGGEVDENRMPAINNAYTLLRRIEAAGGADDQPPLLARTVSDKDKRAA